MSSILIRGGTIYDGRGNEPYDGDISIIDGKIKQETIESPDYIIEAEGLCIAPGFIDAHSHGDFCIGNMHNSLSKVSQGITSQVTGVCGSSVFPLNNEMFSELKEELTPSFLLKQIHSFPDFKSYLQYAKSISMVENTAFFVGHNNLRRIVMGNDNRKPAFKELEEMKDMLNEAMEMGALGLSSGLIYIPGAYSDIEEMVSLCEIVAGYDGIYVTHMRNEADKILSSVGESIEVARRSGCRLNISHLKICGIKNHGIAKKVLNLIYDARREGIILAVDQYPYEASATGLASCIPPGYFAQGTEKLIHQLQDPAVRQAIKEEMCSLNTDFENIYLGCGGFGGIMIGYCDDVPDCTGKFIDEYAKEKGADPFDIFFDLLISSKGEASAIYFDINREDILDIIKDKTIMVGTDGASTSSEEYNHPRTYGTFTRVLGRYGRDMKVLPIQSIIYKMTGLTAHNMGFDTKGIIAHGMDADLVIFNLNTVIDNSDFINPCKLSSGIEYVIVDGKIVYKDGKLTGRTPGKIIQIHKKKGR